MSYTKNLEFWSPMPPLERPMQQQLQDRDEATSIHQHNPGRVTAVLPVFLHKSERYSTRMVPEGTNNVPIATFIPSSFHPRTLSSVFMALLRTAYLAARVWSSDRPSRICAQWLQQRKEVDLDRCYGSVLLRWIARENRKLL